MTASAPELHKGLKQRHLTMIAIGGVIGAGLFVGSGVVINETGPAAFLTYALTGVLIVLVMRMLGEMAAANPSTGSFADYARRALGGWAGLLRRLAVLVLLGHRRRLRGGRRREDHQVLVRGRRSGCCRSVLMVLMTATNLISVSSYGEFEYWFAGIKVVAIIVFLVLGALFVLGLWPNQGLDFSNLTAHGGFFPNGAGAIFSGIVVVDLLDGGRRDRDHRRGRVARPRDGDRQGHQLRRSCGSRSSSSARSSCSPCILPWNDTELGASPYVARLQRRWASRTPTTS